MALQLQLNALVVPEGTEFPGTVQDFLQMIEQYMEITGGEDFDGVNYGNVEPAAEDRDKAWFRTDISGTPLGWYAWNGAEWEVLPAKAFVGTTIDRDELTDPQEGTLFMVTGTGLSVWNGAEWEWAFPEAAAQATYDRNAFLEAWQQVASVTSAVGTWTSVDLDDYIADAGIESPNVAKAVYVGIECGFTQTGFASGPNNFNVTLRVTQDSGVSTSSNTLLKASAQATQDDDRVSAQAQNSAVIPLPNGQTDIYYSVSVDGAPPGVFAKVYVYGFIF